jgi:hypothetical protein
MRKFVPLIVVMFATPALATAEPHTVAAVIAADDAWLQAEMRGDGDYLDQLLMPEYRSVGVSGKATTKAQLVANARKRGADPALAEQITAWKAAHPSHAEVDLNGDTAVLRWQLDGDKAGLTSSSDIFVYSDGHWRAVYSQHTSASS